VSAGTPHSGSTPPTQGCWPSCSSKSITCADMGRQ
jgi:hypothetical protein